MSDLFCAQSKGDVNRGGVGLRPLHFAMQKHLGQDGIR
jgi:hypothetical protein